MDNPSLDHSDSDSGESWTLLERSPSPICENAPSVFTDNPVSKPIEIKEKDEDTDGISIISESENEGESQYELLKFEHIPEPGEELPSQQPVAEPHPLEEPTSHNSTHVNLGSIKDDAPADNDYSNDNDGKIRTYVHRRNKRLSTVLNVIVLGSVITAAGIAVGHMWGVRDDCAIQNSQSINKVLSNLYKLQEENNYLRTKLKELTMVNARKVEKQKLPPKQNRCKKVFEESLNNKNVGKVTSCVDNVPVLSQELRGHLVEQQFEKDFVEDINKLKKVYDDNKDWLDKEIDRRLKQEGKYADIHVKNDSNTNIKTNKLIDSCKATNDSKLFSKLSENKTVYNDVIEKKISYADSLKSNSSNKRSKRALATVPDIPILAPAKKRAKTLENTTSNKSLSDDEILKDDRYVRKSKYGTKKKDRHPKIHKKQKRRNKYEQWEMKGGYNKDYDAISLASIELEEARQTLDTKDKLVNTVETFTSKPDRVTPKDKKRAKIKDDIDWFEKRALQRKEARNLLEIELFGEGKRNTAAWYFRRMQKRDQCRNKDDRKSANFYKNIHKQRNMNFKVKQ